ncbi:MAG: NUDIX hydrolase [Xenococcaceae cyanobacterium MO_188.B32]|nr:NUDIX hydrolase [Xenococcaceae cyanobacterium MO_188.B32]
MRRSWRFISTVLGIIFRHPIPGITLIPVLPDGRIVLVQRRDSGKWGLPGGMIDWGEDIPNTAYRELVEETGLELVKIRRLVGVYSAPDRDPRIHSISVLVEVEAKGNLEVKDKLEIIEAKAFFPEDLPSGDLSHDHDRQLKDYFNGLTTIA